MTTSSAIPLEQINQKLLRINEQYQKVFTNPQYKSPLLNRKSFSLVMQTIYSFVQTGTTEIKVRNKQLFLTLFRSYMRNFINSHILLPLSKTVHYDDFEDMLSQKWKDFKQLTFYYFALLNSANAYYETAYFSFIQMGIYLDADSPKSIFPIPVIALNLLKTLILNQFQDKIEVIVLNSIKGYRKKLIQKTQNLKNILELIWSCGLGELARIRIIPGRGVDFYKEQRIEFTAKLKLSTPAEDFFSLKILNKVLEETNNYYSEEYETKLRSLFPIEQFKSINQIIEKEFNFSEEFFLTKTQRRLYMGRVYDRLTVYLEERLKAPGSFKSLLQNYRYTSEQGYADIRLFFDVIKTATRISDQKSHLILKIIENIFVQIISEQGKEINQKINKRRQHILQMLTVKKSIDKVLDELAGKNIMLLSTKEKTFKKILDSIEASRNLADFADFTIKECVRLKLDEERSYEKFSDVFLLLNSITSTDSFLLYHQESMGKRIVESLNQPKLEFEILMLKKLSQRMGVMSITSHMSMIKDMELSQQLTEKYNNRLPFSSFKWSLKIFNPSYWPESINKEKLSIEIPNCLLHQAKAVEDLYHSQNQYRYLNWKLQKGTSLFQGRYQNRKVRFQSENSYLMVLLLISQQPENRIIYGNLKHLIKTEKENQQTNNMSKHDPLTMLLYVLIENKLIVRKNIENKYAPFSQSQELQINKNYTLPETMPKGQQVVLIRPSQEMAKNIQQSSIEKNKIMKDRQKLIEAVLVKVLKHSHATGDNSVTFVELFQAVKEHHMLGGFNFSEGLVKQRLQELIAREYCVRDEEDRKIYHYVA